MGFNTDLSKAQVITKDEDKVLDAELHTDLLNQSERDKIAEAGEKIGDLAGALANSNDGGIFNTYKENRFGNLLNDYIKKSGVSGLFLDDKISLEDKRNALNNLVEGFLKDRGYTGPMPEIHIGSESFAVDSDKGFGAGLDKNGKEKNKNYLVVKFNETEDINSAKDLILNESNNAYKEKLNPNDLVISGKTDTEMIKQVFNSLLNYQKNTNKNPIDYSAAGLSPQNCNTWFFNMAEYNDIQNNISDFGGGFADLGAKKELDQNLWKENGGKSGR